MEELTETVADQLGYCEVPLECKLYKLLVYGEGGHLTKHRDTEKADGMIATLVIHPPSLHEGGDLIVYRNGEKKYYHDFGKKAKEASYLPHFAVHYADAEHSLVYSVCLPPALRYSRGDSFHPLPEKLADAIKMMTHGDQSFALLLSHEYTEKSIEDLVSAALKGVDRARFRALEEANDDVPLEKRLHFFIVKLSQEIEYRDKYPGGPEEEWNRTESITYFSARGGSFGCAEDIEVKFNFLNPGLESLSCLWESLGTSTHEDEGDLGNETATRNSTYGQYAIVAWPAAKMEMTFQLINQDAALEVFQEQNTVNDAATAESLNEAIGGAVGTVQKFQNPSFNAFLDVAMASLRKNKAVTVTVNFARGVCELVIANGDPALASRFFEEFWGRVSPVNKELLIPSVISMTRTFGWSTIGDAVLKGLDGNTDISAMTIALQLADNLEQELITGGGSLIKFAADKATALSDAELCTAGSIGLLGKFAMSCNDKTVFETVKKKFDQIESSLFGPALAEFTTYSTSRDKEDEKWAVLAKLAERRIKWLNHQIRSLDKPFSWEMADAFFPKNAKVEAFLRGPNETMDTTGILSFSGIRKAQNFAAKWMSREQINASFEMEAGERDGKAFVTIAKTRKWFNQRQEQMQESKNELNALMGHNS